MKNIILTGMPGSGKSTLGVLLAKTLGVDFIDTDLVIQKNENRLLHDIISSEGISRFLDIERDNILSLELTGTVIATGGSAVLRDASMKHLKKNGVVVWLYVPCAVIERRIKNITTRGIAAKADEDIRDIYRVRQPFYKEYADITVKCSGRSAEKNVSQILTALVASEKFTI